MPRRRARIAIAAVVLAGHVAMLIGLVAAFAPNLGRQVVARGLAAVEITSPPPPPPPPPQTERRATIIARRPPAPAAPAPAAAAALPLAAPAPLIPLAIPTFAAPVAGNGIGLSAGAGGAGQGQGGRGTGSGPGGGGIGIAGDPVKTGGGIDLARDYDPATRALRLGDYVVIELAVGPDGVPTGCTVTRPSGDAAANALTCRLAVARFRFRPAHDADGRAVAGTYGWKQVWKK